MNEEFPTILVMFGATGDLARRKLIPALWQLYCEDRLPKLLQIIGYSRQELTDEAWREIIESIVGEIGGGSGQRVRE